VPCAWKVGNGQDGIQQGLISLPLRSALIHTSQTEYHFKPILYIQLPHRPVATIPRGGANTSDHVDILGSTGLSEIILKVATGVGDEIEDNFVSDIREYAKKINWD
jgi:hypothetical protein